MYCDGLKNKKPSKYTQTVFNYVDLIRYNTSLTRLVARMMMM